MSEGAPVLKERPPKRRASTSPGEIGVVISDPDTEILSGVGADSATDMATATDMPVNSAPTALGLVLVGAGPSRRPSEEASISAMSSFSGGDGNKKGGKKTMAKMKRKKVEALIDHESESEEAEMEATIDVRPPRSMWQLWPPLRSVRRA